MSLTLVDNDLMPLTSKDGNPAVVETYGEQVRQSFLDRPDHLHFRIQEKDEVVRLFGPGRTDSVREVEESTTKRHLVFGGDRPDQLVDYIKETILDCEVGKEECTTETYSYKYSGSVLKSAHLALRGNCPFELSSDTPPIIFREKALHIALKFNEMDVEETPHRMLEVFQDQNQHVMRVIVQNDDDMCTQETRHFRNDVANDSAVYDTAKGMIADFIQQFVAVERELFLSLPEFVPQQTEAQAIDTQRERLQSLARSLFSSIDNYTADPRKKSDRLEETPKKIEAPRKSKE